MAKEIALVYLVAGISSRFNGKIKQFAEIGPNNETLMEYSLNQALKTKFTKIVFIVGNLTEVPFKEKFGDSYKGIPIYYTLQKYDEEKRDRPWGTTDALVTIKKYVECPFVVCNGDDIYGEQAFKILYDHLLSEKDSAAVGYKLENTLSESGTVNRGVIKLNGDYMEEVVETLNIDSKSGLIGQDKICSMNLFGFHADILNLMEAEVIKFKEQHNNDRKVEIFLTSIITTLINNKTLKMRVYSTSETWYGITYLDDVPITKKRLLT
jgi:NDP-sugar pyrophosphorylase family protein